jgi:Protein of unknown function (DUF2971)
MMSGDLHLISPLYHYTDQKGFLGIVRTKTIWMTHTQYLNDRREFLHALDLVREEIKRLLSVEDQESSRARALTQMEQALGLSPQSINVCVCSFSEESDSLSQWRAYGTPGFALGFSGTFLKEAADKQKFYLARCVYDQGEQFEIVRALVEEVLEENLSPKPDNGSEDAEDYDIRIKLGGNLLPYVNRYAPLLKHESFEGEREWRIVSRPRFSSDQSVDFREGKSLLIPFYKLDLTDAKNEFHIHRIVIGPTKDEMRSRSSVISFLMHERILRRGFSEIPVEVSNVPYRDW